MIYKPYCIDIYQGDDVVDAPGQPLAGFVQVKAQGIAFLDHKASQGTTEADSRVALRYQHWMNGIAIPVVDVDKTVLSLQPRFGFYHFNGTGAASVEAAKFLSVVKPLFNKGDDLCLDYEDIGASGYQQPMSWADDFCKAVEDWCQFSIKVYGGDCPREQALKASDTILDNMAKRRYWDCQYGGFDPADVPLPWRQVGPSQWQDDGDSDGPGPHTILGIANYCDNSTVVGSWTVAKLYAAWGGGPIAVPVPAAPAPSGGIIAEVEQKLGL